MKFKQTETFFAGNGAAVLTFTFEDRAQVWAHTDPISTRCTACSGPLVAMKSNCKHCRAVKKHLVRMQTNPCAESPEISSIK